MSAVVIGVGNEYRRDDGIGPAVAAAVATDELFGVTVVQACGDPTELLDAWDGADLAVVIDAAAGPECTPGRLRRWDSEHAAGASAVSSHALDLPQTYALGQAIGRLPERLVIVTVDAADTGYGTGLTPAVAAALPDVVNAVRAEIAAVRALR